MSSNTPTTAEPPRLPAELLEIIIQAAWDLPLSTHDRATLMKSSLGVNTTWLNIFLPVACKDVHIPSVEYALTLHQILTGCSEFYNKFAPGMVDRLCRSITFHGTNDLKRPPELVLGDHPTAVAMSIALHLAHTAPTERFLGLRCIRIHYKNCMQRDIFGRKKYFEFPEGWSDLEVVIGWDDDVSEDVVREYRESEESLCLGVGVAPNVRRLRVVGATEGMMKEIKLACPNVLRIEES